MARSSESGNPQDSGPEESGSSIARRFRRGDPGTVARVRERAGRIVAYRGYGIPDGEREDLEQEVMAQLWRAANSPDFDPGAGFWGLVETIVARRCIDWYRSRRETKPVPAGLEDAGADPLDSTLAAEKLRLASTVVSTLGRSCRELIELHFRQGRTYRDISRIVGKSEGAVRAQMYRCLRKAKRTFSKLIEEKGSL